MLDPMLCSGGDEADSVADTRYLAAHARSHIEALCEKSKFVPKTALNRRMLGSQ